MSIDAYTNDGEKMELQAELKKQEGQTLETLSHKKDFQVVAVTERGVLVQAEGSKERQVTWRQLDPAWAHLQRRGKLNQFTVRDKYSKVNAGYVLALLATLPGVTAGKEKDEEAGRVAPTLYLPGAKAKPRRPKKAKPKPKAKKKQREENDWAVWMS